MSGPWIRMPQEVTGSHCSSTAPSGGLLCHSLSSLCTVMDVFTVTDM